MSRSSQHMLIRKYLVHVCSFVSISLLHYGAVDFFRMIIFCPIDNWIEVWTGGGARLGLSFTVTAIVENSGNIHMQIDERYIHVNLKCFVWQWYTFKLHYRQIYCDEGDWKIYIFSSCYSLCYWPKMQFFKPSLKFWG